MKVKIPDQMTSLVCVKRKKLLSLNVEFNSHEPLDSLHLLSLIRTISHFRWVILIAICVSDAGVVWKMIGSHFDELFIKSSMIGVVIGLKCVVMTMINLLIAAAFLDSCLSYSAS